MTRTLTTEEARTRAPVYVAGNKTVHAGRRAGFYPSGASRWEKLCGNRRTENHAPMELEPGTAITCARCLAKMA